MKITPCLLLASLPLTSLGLSGCQTSGQTFQTAQVVHGMADIVQFATGNQQLANVMRAGAGVLAITATVQQESEARERAQYALRSPVFRGRLAARHCRYVAVGVHKSERQKEIKTEKVVVLYDTKTEKVVGDAYEPKKAHYHEGDDVSFGGKTAVVCNSFSGV